MILLYCTVMHFCHWFRKNKSSRIIESLIALQLHQILDPSIFPKHFCRQVLCDLCWKVIWNKRQEQYIYPPFCWVLRGKNMFHCVFIQSRDTPWHILDFILKNHLLHSIAKTVPRKYLIPLRERPSLRSLPFFMMHCFAEFCNKKNYFTTNSENEGCQKHSKTKICLVHRMGTPATTSTL